MTMRQQAQTEDSLADGQKETWYLVESLYQHWYISFLRLLQQIIINPVLKQQRFSLSQSWRLEVRNQGHTSSGGPKGKSILCLFTFLVAISLQSLPL